MAAVRTRDVRDRYPRTRSKNDGFTGGGAEKVRQREEDMHERVRRAVTE
jgi:hypothetical protein